MAKFNSKSTKPEVESIDEEKEEQNAIPSLKSLFDRIPALEEEVSDAKDLLEEKEHELSDAIGEIHKHHGSGPWEWPQQDGRMQYVTVVGRKSEGKGMTFFLKGRGVKKATRVE